MKSLYLIIAIIAIATTAVFAQESFRVGEEVEVHCTCLGPMAWVRGRVEEVTGGNVRVRYGTGKYQFTTVPNSPQTIVRPGARQAAATDNALKNQFFQEASRFRDIVIEFAPFYDPKFQRQRLPSPEKLQASIDQLAALDALCQAKYPNLKDDPRSPWPNDVTQQPATWCAIAAARASLEARFRAETAKTFLQTELNSPLANLNKALRDKDNRASDDAQRIVYSRAAWRSEMEAKFAPKFAALKTAMPSDFFAEVDQKADELRSAIDRTAPSRSWTKPPYNDAAVEAFVRAKYASDPDYRGAKVLKTGLDYTTWKEYESLSYLGSDSNFRYYKVEYNEYKRGWALVKLVDRPLCQAQEFIVGRQNGKIVLVSLGGSGIFMKCE